MSYAVKSELLVNVSPFEIRLAIMEDGLLQEVHIERPHSRGLVGNIYKGKVARVLPGMQAAFVDIGLERAGFLHVSDVMPLRKLDEEPIESTHPDTDVKKWLHEGQEVLVQVLKDPLGTKGARLTTHLSLASRYLVYMPDLLHVGVSVRLENEKERERLQALLSKALKSKEPQGYIIRTVAEGATEAELTKDIAFLTKWWDAISQQAKKAKAPSLVHEDLPLIKRCIRDMVNENVEKLRVDSPTAFQELEKFVKEFVPDVLDKLSLYDGQQPIFDMYNVEAELEKALERNVALKSGGYLIIDQTEAMTTVDVNTGGFVGTSNLEETIFKTNLEAAQAIGRQLRLRNLGGIIILDFIDMNDQEHKQQLMSTLEKVLAQDHARTNISEISSLGLVQMTRKRTQESLSQQLCETCPHCEGRAVVKTVETLCYEIFREILREAKAYEDAAGFMVLAADELVDWLLNESPQWLGELEASLNRPIKLKRDANYSREQYDIVLL